MDNTEIIIDLDDEEKGESMGELKLIELPKTEVELQSLLELIGGAVLFKISEKNITN